MSLQMESNKFYSKVIYSEKLPVNQNFFKNTFLIYDRKLPRVSNEIKEWIKKHSNSYGVTAGESLKDISNFPSHIKQITKIISKKELSEVGKLDSQLNSKNLIFVALGGGSVGDFVGFVASIYKRGVNLIQVPSTWLAAIDSAHGGKTALNVFGAKNQLGTFYPAKKVYLVKSLLSGQKEKLVIDASSELIKMSLISGGTFWKKVIKEQLKSNSDIWKLLKLAVDGKYKIVRQDPYERSNIRQILNFGHTVGHVFESHYEISHGQAVMQGLYFSLVWSLKKKVINQKNYEEIYNWLLSLEKRKPWVSKGVMIKRNLKPIRSKVFYSLLVKDKKQSSGKKVNFVFIRRAGDVFVKPVSFDEVLSEAQSQGWVF